MGACAGVCVSACASACLCAKPLHPRRSDCQPRGRHHSDLKILNFWMRFGLICHGVTPADTRNLSFRATSEVIEKSNRISCYSQHGDLHEVDRSLMCWWLLFLFFFFESGSKRGRRGGLADKNREYEWGLKECLSRSSQRHMELGGTGTPFLLCKLRCLGIEVGNSLHY